MGWRGEGIVRERERETDRRHKKKIVENESISRHEGNNPQEGRSD